jgi:hypothetical protein
MFARHTLLVTLFGIQHTEHGYKPQRARRAHRRRRITDDGKRKADFSVVLCDSLCPLCCAFENLTRRKATENTDLSLFLPLKYLHGAHTVGCVSTAPSELTETANATAIGLAMSEPPAHHNGPWTCAGMAALVAVPAIAIPIATRSGHNPGIVVLPGNGCPPTNPKY